MGNQYVHIAEIISHLENSGCINFVVCPGSRNAPIIDYLTRLSSAKIYSHIDERSAAYIALGIAKKVNRPVAIVCTSGTAALNFAPAMAEAYYQNVCLVAITADRPMAAANTFESQTINQNGIFQNFIGTEISIDMSKEWTLNFRQTVGNKTEFALINNLPLHINLHLYEPLYDLNAWDDYGSLYNTEILSSKSYFSSYRTDKAKLEEDTLAELNKHEKILMVLGFETQSEEFNTGKETFPYSI